LTSSLIGILTEIGADGSWQVEYLPGHFVRIHHVRKKYACQDCESNGNDPRIESAAKSETAIDKGMLGPGLLAYIVTSKFFKLLTTLSVGGHLSAAGIRDLAGDAVSLVRGFG
jgi:transposase